MDQECLKRNEELKSYPRMFDWVDRWAKEKPKSLAIIEYSTGEEITWKDFATKSKLLRQNCCQSELKRAILLRPLFRL